MDKNEKQEELKRLYRLLHERDQEFEKAKGKRTIITILVFTAVYLWIFWQIVSPSGLEDFVAILFGAAFFGGLHFWVNASIFWQLSRIGREEGEVLENIRKRIKEVEKSDPH